MRISRCPKPFDLHNAPPKFHLSGRNLARKWHLTFFAALPLPWASEAFQTIASRFLCAKQIVELFLLEMMIRSLPAA
jgi:hypothetical protein